MVNGYRDRYQGRKRIKEIEKFFEKIGIPPIKWFIKREERRDALNGTFLWRIISDGEKRGKERDWLKLTRKAGV